MREIVFSMSRNELPVEIEGILHMQVGNVNFAFSLQQLVNLPLLWSLEAHLNVTNATYPQAVPVRLLPTPVR